MALSRSEFDGGRWAPVRPNDTADPTWAGTLKAATQKSSCNGKTMIGPVSSDRSNGDEDIRQIPYRSACGADWFTVEAHAKAEDGSYPALYIFDRNHNLIVEFDSQLGSREGAGFVEGRDEVVHEGSYTAYYKADLPDDTNKTSHVFIELTTHGERLGDVSIETADTHANLLPTEHRLENPLIDRRNPDSDGLFREFHHDNFSKHPNIGIQFESW